MVGPVATKISSSGLPARASWRAWRPGAFLALALLLLAAPARAEGAASAWFATPQGRVRLIAAVPAVGSAAAVELGLEFRLSPKWKIYWRSPGDAGYPPRFNWAGSVNLAAATVAWPAPHRFAVLGLETAGYEGTVVLPIRARLAEPGAPLAAHLVLEYLTCSNICIPYRTTLDLALPTAAPAGAQDFAPLINRYVARVPGNGRDGELSLAGATLRPGTPAVLELVVRSDRPLDRPDAFIEGAQGVSFTAPDLRPGPAVNESVLRIEARGPGAAVASLVGQSLTVTVVDGDRATQGTVTPVAGPPAVDLARLVPMLLVALLGGLVLNVMPCVLPVLSLKLIGALEHAELSRRAVRTGFLATAAGILLSFLALAAAMVALTQAGVAAGWGMQFQQPLFLAGMAALLTLFAGNLWDLFAVPLPRAVTDRMGRAGLGKVATGAFATLLATPCSAPFLGTALGFAFASGPVEIVAIFTALGIGFAAPYLVVAAVPRLVRLLPRPGRWMIVVRRALGVALAGTALWLVTVLAAERGATAALALGLVLAALLGVLALLRAGWTRRGAAAALVAAALAVPMLMRAPPPAPETAGLWRPFDPAILAALVHDRQVVFVDVTAQWCLTCKLNERLVLNSASIAHRLGAPGVVAMRADWTRPNAEIAGYLRSFGRYGIPFNAVYGPGAPTGLALPEILTKDAVRAALAAAARAGPDRQG